MWHTNTGDRTLEGPEARLLAEALWDFLSELEVEGGDFDAGLEAFDSLTFGQKVSVLTIVGNGLLRPEVPICEPTAAVESGIAAIFEYLKELVIVEIDDTVAPRNIGVCPRRGVDQQTYLVENSSSDVLVEHGQLRLEGSHVEIKQSVVVEISAIDTHAPL